jgi:O-antigen/teichoic acid export membrane protein
MTTAATTTTVAAPDHRAAAPVVVRHASALMLSTVASAALGFAFWVVAARWFPATVVGQASAAVSAMTLLAGIAQLNLASLYARYVPTAGRRARSILLSGAAASTAMAVAASALYLWLGPVHAPGGRALFAVAVIASALYFIADGAFTALGRATRVPIKNVATSAGKLALVVAFGFAIGPSAAALMLAWVVPIVVAVGVVGWLVLRRYVPAFAREQSDHEAAIPRGEIARFAGAEYVNAIVSNTVAFAPPVLVSAVVGPTRGAYFYLPWLVGVAATTMLWNIVTSFVAAASRESDGARGHLVHSVRLGALIAGGGALVLAVGAEPLLSILGPQYALQGATALRLIGLTLPFTAMVLLYGAFCVMRGRMWGLTAVQASAATAFFALATVWMHHLGLTGPALAYLIAQAAVALTVLPTVIRRYRAFGKV